MALYKKDVTGSGRGIANLIVQSQNNEDQAKLQQKLGIESQAAKQKQDVKTLQDLAGSAPEGASVKVGDVSVGQDPMAKMMQMQMKGGVAALQKAHSEYNKQSPKIQDQANAAFEGLELSNDPKNIGSMGQARTLALKSMGMNRYNEQEAKAVLPGHLQGMVSSLFNSTGGDETPLDDSQRRSLNTFFNHMANTAKERHDLLRANVKDQYNANPFADPNRIEGLGAPLDTAINQKLDKYKSLANTKSTPAQVQQQQQQAPDTVDKLRNFLGGMFSPSQPAQPQQQAAPQQAPMSFEEFKKRKAAGQL